MRCDALGVLGNVWEVSEEGDPLYETGRGSYFLEEHPEELVGQTKESYDEICHMGYDERFLETCESVLEDLKN